MKFDEFWNILSMGLSSPKQLTTLKQKKEFSVKYSGGIIEIIPQNKQQRSIGKNEFFKVWKVAKNTVDPFKPSNYTDISFHSSYIVTIMKYFLKGNKIE